jgi:hypothetical protein
MGLNIKNAETEAAIRALAELTGEKLTVAIQNAVQEKLERLRKTGAPLNLPDYLDTLSGFQDALNARVIDSADRRTGRELLEEGR